MHFHFNFSAAQVLWTLNFAAELVLLVVLLGRDRVRRYPWFTASIGLFTLRLLAEELLANRTAPLLYQEIILALGDVAVIVGLLVLVEVARRAFAGAKRSMWIVNSAGVLLVAGGVVVELGQWPALKDLDWKTTPGMLRLMQLVALKGEMLESLLAIELGLLVVLFGRHFKGGWRSHAQQIAIGLSTKAITLLTLQQVVLMIIKSAHPHTQAEYQRVVGFIGRLSNATTLLYLALVLWWIVWLWLDEPGTTETPASETAEEPQAAGE
jgi:hypothetical protein